MALIVNTNIRNDTGFLTEAEQIGVDGQGLDGVIAQRPPVEVVTEMPATPVEGTVYLVVEEETDDD